jgi:NOL1/NOP2/fmu family ribosome biogenesis protein
MKIDIMDKSKKKKILEQLEYLGVKKSNLLLLKSGKEKIRAFSGSFDVEEIYTLWRLFPVEGLGLYFAKQNIDRSGVKETRLSVDALHLLKDQITENIVYISQEQEKSWFRGKDIDLEEPIKNKGFVAVKSKETEDFLGTGKVGQDKRTIFNFLPKERRVKN